MSNQIHIRPIKKQDLPALAQLVRPMWLQHADTEPDYITKNFFKTQIFLNTAAEESLSNSFAKPSNSPINIKSKLLRLVSITSTKPFKNSLPKTNFIPYTQNTIKLFSQLWMKSS